MCNVTRQGYICCTVDCDKVFARRKGNERKEKSFKRNEHFGNHGNRFMVSSFIKIYDSVAATKPPTLGFKFISTLTGKCVVQAVRHTNGFFEWFAKMVELNVHTELEFCVSTSMKNSPPHRDLYTAVVIHARLRLDSITRSFDCKTRSVKWFNVVRPYLSVSL